ncbi:hypothetical protein BDV3_003342 [Batrachochytrium dendrobatidis]
MVQLLHVVIGLIASTSSVRAIEQTSISDVSLAENTHGLSVGVVDPLLTSGGNCPSDGRNCDNDPFSSQRNGASDAAETTSVRHLATRALLSPTCQPFINPFMNEGTRFLNAISYIMYNPVVAGPTTMGCYCSDDGTNTICVTSRSQFHYTSVQDFVIAIGNPTVSSQLNSYCWKCNRTAPVIEAVASAFSVSVYPSAIAAGIQPLPLPMECLTLQAAIVLQRLSGLSVLLSSLCTEFNKYICYHSSLLSLYYTSATMIADRHSLKALLDASSQRDASSRRVISTTTLLTLPN